MRFRLVLPIALAALAAVPAAASAQQPAVGGVVAFTRDADGPVGPAEPVISVAAPDGTGERVYATGSAPALALEGTAIAYTVRAGNAFQVVVGDLRSPAPPVRVTRFADREEEFGPRRHGAVGSVWSPGGAWLALRVQEGSTTTLAVVRPDGSGFRKLEFGHLFGSVVAWRDDETLAVGTDTGLKLVTVAGAVSDLPGAARTDTPVAFQRTGALVVNGADGIAVVETGGTRRPLLAGAQGWSGAFGGGVTYTTDADIGYVGLDGRPARAAAIPAGGQVLGVVAARTGTLVEVAGSDGASTIYALPLAPSPGTPRRVLDGADLSLTNAVSVADVVPPGSAPTTPSPTAPPGTAAPGQAAPGERSAGGAAPGPVDPPAGRSAVSEALPRASEVGTDPSTLLVNLLVTLVLMLLITFPAELFNNTLEEHYDEVRGWFRLRPRGSRPPRSRPVRIAAFAAYTAVAAVLYALLDPRVSLDAATARTWLGTAVGIAVVTLLFAVVPLVYVRRRHGDRGLLRVLPGTLAVAVVCVLVSRLARFEPGYLYGVVGGFAFSLTLSKEEEGRGAAVAAGWVLLASVLAWLAWQPVDTRAAAGDPGLLLGLTDTTLATIAVGGLQGLVIGLVPLRSLQGHKLFRWNKAVWAAAFGVVVFAFVHLLLHPSNAETHPAFVTWLALFLGFGAVSVAFWGYFQLRRPSSG